jgi:hypothetical protein
MTKTFICNCNDCHAKCRVEVEDGQNVKCPECYSRDVSLEEIENN